MEEVWVVYLCFFLFFIVLILMKQKPEDEIRREKESEISSWTPSTYHTHSSGRRLECTEEELEASLERLSGILFSVDTRKREPHHEHKASPPSGKEPGPSQSKIQERASHPGSHENIVDEIEQAVQETVDSEVYVKRRQPRTVPRSHREAQWTEMTEKF